MERRRFSFRSSSPTCYLDRHPREQRGLFVICCGFDKCRPDYRVERVNHPVFVIEYIMRGEGELRAGGRQWRLHGGMVFFYGPGVPHVYGTDPKNTMEKVWVVYSGTESAAITRKTFGATYGAFRVSSPETVFSLIELICNEIMNKGPRSQLICDSYLRALLPLLAAGRMPDRQRATEALQMFLRCKTFIDDNFYGMHSPFEVCTRLGLSPSYLCRLFRHYADRTPGAYLARLKLNTAAYLLVSSDLSVKQVAARLAYSDQYNFSRAYKRFFGISPLHYRRGSPSALEGSHRASIAT